MTPDTINVPYKRNFNLCGSLVVVSTVRYSPKLCYIDVSLLYCDHRLKLFLHQGRQMNTHCQDLYLVQGFFKLVIFVMLDNTVHCALTTCFFTSLSTFAPSSLYEQISHVLMDMTYHICHIGVEMEDLLVDL